MVVSHQIDIATQAGTALSLRPVRDFSRLRAAAKDLWYRDVIQGRLLARMERLSIETNNSTLRWELWFVQSRKGTGWNCFKKVDLLRTTFSTHQRRIMHMAQSAGLSLEDLDQRHPGTLQMYALMEWFMRETRDLRKNLFY